MNETKDISLSVKLVHYDNLRQDIRDEMKQRITQRDNLAIQFFVFMGVIITGTIAATEYLLLLLPFVAFYFTTQILYSYRIHYALKCFLVERVEKNIIRIIDSDDRSEWQSFIDNPDDGNSRAISTGVRKNFFIGCIWVVSLGSIICSAMLFIINNKTNQFHIIVIAACFAISILLNTITTYRFAGNKWESEIKARAASSAEK